MIALARHMRVPCRYVSGYLFHRVEYNDRSAQDATHAWVEALRLITALSQPPEAEQAAQQQQQQQ